VADGGNLDDLDDYRPGARAVRELGIISPLREAGLSKAEVRRLSAQMGLSTWDKPAYACLASRIPYGQALTRADLERVEKAEDLLLSLGFREVRVRCHERLARLEVGPEERPRFFDARLMDQVQRELTALGFSFVTLDLAGYRSGSLNIDVKEDDRLKYAQNRS
jgi:ATP-utilizing enzymes of the PP-loop superfamily